jgi:hypothetical protein
MTNIVKAEKTTSVKVADPELRDKIFRLEEFIIQNCEPCEVKWIHRFTPGLYSREMIVEPDTLITGAIHKTEHLSIFLEGVMMLPNEEIIEAPRIEICQPGVKRVGIALERCRWITFHPTGFTNHVDCEEAYFTNDPNEVPDVAPSGFSYEQIDFGMAQRKLLEHQ